MATTAGPGQKPLIPRPIPKAADPSINFASIVLLVGISNLSANKGLLRLRTHYMPGAAAKIAPPITKANAASQFALKSKKLSTRAGLLIPEISNPKPNKRPQMSEAITWKDLQHHGATHRIKRLTAHCLPAGNTSDRFVEALLQVTIANVFKTSLQGLNMKMSLRLVLLITLVFCNLGIVNSKELEMAEGLAVVITSGNEQTQMMAMVISLQTIKAHGKSVHRNASGLRNELFIVTELYSQWSTLAK
ncbi:hypothetical protein KO518_18675 [Aestuariibacter sp. A3R04]|nr:hypothetical protein [Aestuariibacter sp. A3R04]MBU3023833.1 hypothetical protein [Aestuariibacter sp. A3R04]